LSTIKNRLRPPPCPTLTALASFFSLFLGTALSFRHEPQKAGKVTTLRTFPAVILIWIISELKEGLIKSARTICERIFITARRDFAGIIVFISRNRNKAVAKNPQSAADAFNQRFLKTRK
jgi:hypothetical protein